MRGGIEGVEHRKSIGGMFISLLFFLGLFIHLFFIFIFGNSFIEI